MVWRAFAPTHGVMPTVVSRPQSPRRPPKAQATGWRRAKGLRCWWCSVEGSRSGGTRRPLRPPPRRPRQAARNQRPQRVSPSPPDRAELRPRGRPAGRPRRLGGGRLCGRRDRQVAARPQPVPPVAHFQTRPLPKGRLVEQIGSTRGCGKESSSTSGRRGPWCRSEADVTTGGPPGRRSTGRDIDTGGVAMESTVVRQGVVETIDEVLNALAGYEERD